MPKDKVVNIASKRRIPNNEYGVTVFLRNSYPLLIEAINHDDFMNKLIIKGTIPWSKQAVHREWSQKDTLECLILCQSFGINVKEDVIHNAIQKLAQSNSYHPIREYLNSLEWDGVPRIDTWLVDYAGVVEDIEISSVFGRKFLIGAVARVFDPGCKVDTIFILEGNQGIGKSTLLKTLAVKDSYFTDSIYNIENKDVFELIRGKWIVEIPELDAFKNLRATRLKQFASSAVDIYRPPYERFQIRQPRQCVFTATTNDTEYLKDETGNRRFWPVYCSTRIKINKLKEIVGMLWAEAKVLYDAKDPDTNKKVNIWYLTAEEEKLAREVQLKRVEADSWMDIIDTYLDIYFNDNPDDIVSIEQILTQPCEGLEGFGKNVVDITKSDRTRVMACVKMIGKYEYSKRRKYGKWVRGFVVK